MTESVYHDPDAAFDEANEDAIKLTRLRAAIMALCEREKGSGLAADLWWIRNLRALLANDGAAALHEHDAQALRGAADLLDSRRSQKGIASRALDPGVAMAEASDRGWSCNKLGCSKSDPCSPGCYTMYKAHPWHDGEAAK